MNRRQATTEGGTASSRPLRAIGYLRVSTVGQAEHGMGLEAQRARVADYAKTNGLELIDVVQEAASGGIKNGEEVSYEHRPILLELLERAKVGEYDVLLVAKLDRLSRDHVSLVLLERKLQKVGVQVVSVAEQNGDGALAEFIRGQLALVAQLERAMILDRVSEGKAQRKAEGRHVHGRIPYAYVSAGEGRLAIDELDAAGAIVPGSPAAVVERIFRDAKDGYRPGRIARDLNRDGIASPQGKAWGDMAVRRILANPIYAGERYGVKRAQPAIVSRRAWNAANQALDDRKR
jgi:site-specific DNA recombinase